MTTSDTTLEKTHLENLWDWMVADWSDHDRKLVYADALDEDGKPEAACQFRQLAQQEKDAARWKAALVGAYNSGVITVVEFRRSINDHT